VLEVLYHHAKFGGARISPAAGVAKNVEFLPAALRTAQIRRYLVYSEADFEVFHKICRLCTSFQDALGVKIWLDLLKGLWSYGCFKLRGRVSPKFQRPLAAKLCVRPGDVFQVKERARDPPSPCQVWWCSYFTRRRDGQKR